ncbi:hypothetical protein Hanom_Chr02g00154611 [Helianthus anomalus]
MKLRLSGMRWGLGRGLERNAQVTTPGGLGFGRGPIGVRFSLGVGHASDPMWSALIGLLARGIAGHFKFYIYIFLFYNTWPSHAGLATPRHTPRTRHSPTGDSNFTCQPMPQTPAPPYPTVLVGMNIHGHW